jgi:chromosome segregation ATPase
MQDSQNYLSEIFTAFVGAGVTWIGRWIFDRNKERKEAQKSEVDLVEQVIKIYKEASQDLENKVKDLRMEMDKLLDEMSTVKSENKALKIENAQLKNQVKKVSTENESLKKQVSGLSSRIKELETNHG